MKRLPCMCAAATVGLALMVVGCASETPRIDANWGVSHELAKANQIMDPDADRNLEPVSGVSGEVAKKVNDKYTQSFEKEAPPSTTYMFQVGGK